MKGRLYLIPTPLGNINPRSSIPQRVYDLLDTIDLYVVEKAKSAGRFLERMGLGEKLRECTLVAADRLREAEVLTGLLDEMENGRNIGVLSEAGCPGIADPGSEIVRAAHDRSVQVVPLEGPSSIVLALMSSGFNGQAFTFHGYLPAERSKRVARLRGIERDAATTRRTQIFIEAPHRNQHLFEDILATCRPETRVCIALDLTLASEYIGSKSVADWRRDPIVLGKRPAIFLIARAWGGT